MGDTVARMDAQEYLRLTLDPDRLAILGALAARPGSADDIAERAGRDRRAALEVLAALVQSGLARHGDRGYEFDREALRAVARQLPAAPPPHPRVGYGMTAAEQDVLARFFRGERLVEIPAAHGKRRVVLERLALEFEPGVRYAEAEVNDVLSHFHDDYASLRRHLVDEGLLDRAAGTYWRSGGRVP